MFSSLTTKIALKKVGLSSKSFDFSSPPAEKPKKLQKNPDGSIPGLDDLDDKNSQWPAWMSMKSLPLTAQAWLTPVPPPIQVAECPKIGDLAPLDRDRKLQFGGGKRVLVVFLRCVGCAFAQKQFLALRTLANRHSSNLTCIAVSHSSPEATRKWIDLVGGAWNVQVVIDEDRSIYAAWGLGLGNVWYMFNPTTQVQGWKEKGWLGKSVADSIQRSGNRGQAQASPQAALGQDGAGDIGAGNIEGPSNIMGNKWQQAGAFAIDGRGTVVWGGKALRADEVMDLDLAMGALGL